MWKSSDQQEAYGELQSFMVGAKLKVNLGYYGALVQDVNDLRMKWAGNVVSWHDSSRKPANPSLTVLV